MADEQRDDEGERASAQSADAAEDADGERERPDGDQQDDNDEGGPIASRLAAGLFKASPLVWTLLAGLIGWAVWATITRNSGSSPVKRAARAVVVPTATGDRTVIGMPCASRKLSTGQPLGANTAVLPKGSGRRVVYVYGCPSGGATGTGGGKGRLTGGAAMVILPAGAPLPGQIKGGASSVVPAVKEVFTVPEHGTDDTIVIQPCIGQPGGSTKPAGRPAAPSGKGILLVPPCGGG